MRNATRSLFILVSMLAACEGPAGQNGATGTGGAAGKDGQNGQNGQNGQTGPTGPAGDAGAVGPPGPAGCDGLAPGESARLDIRLGVAAPANGMYFKSGDQAVVTIDLTDRCQRPVDPASLATMSLYLAGPRASALTKAATRLLNCSTDRKAADHQHHFINLLKPSFADGTQNNLTATSTGWTFTTGAVSDEAPGTYTVGVWAVTKDQLDQQLLTADLQIGTSTVETYASGEGQASTCYSCHLGTMSGKSYQAHIVPGYAPFGNYALDQTPIANCKLCHNNDGYSANPIIAKVHGAHRGEHLTHAGAGHPEYGLPADATIASFVNVAFPDFPNAEKDCRKCHADDKYLDRPSRMACGTCHDNVFFDTGVLDPPRAFGKPFKGTGLASGSAFSCVVDADCYGFGQLATCDQVSGQCFRKTHPREMNDTQCAVCHSGDPQALSPITARHDVPSRNPAELDGVTLSDITVSGMSGSDDGGSFFRVGDVPVVTFKLRNKAGSVNALVNAQDPNYANWSTNIIISGPNEKPQRVWAMTNMKTAVDANKAPLLTYDANAGAYTFKFPTATGEVGPGWPAKAQLPLNSQPGVLPSARQVNQSGSYTLWMYIVETLRPGAPNIRNVSWREPANFVTSVRFGSGGAAQPRQVVVQNACDSCHVVTQAHGGSRARPDACFTCHSAGAEDQGVLGTLGARCTANTQATDCTGFNAGWQACQDTNNDSVADTCVTTRDPTPGQVIDFSVMIHQIHFARKLDGWNQRNNIPYASKLQINQSDFSEPLFPQDVRNCTKCHGDAGGQCSAKAPCGVGQSCVAGTCQNTAFTAPSTRVCLSCHDSGAAYAHAALNTFQDVSGPIESCGVCHGAGAGFDVKQVHDIATPYVPPYARE